MHQTKTGWAILVAACMGSVAISGCSSEDPAEQPMMGVKTGTELKGAAAYTILSGEAATPSTAPAPAKYSVCSACHQAAGQGFAQIAPEIRHTPVGYATWIIRNGRAGTSMVAYPATSADPVTMPALTDAELTEVINWLNAMPKPTTGQGLYQSFCGNCHGPQTPSGGAVPVDIRGLEAAKVNMVVRAGANTADPSQRAVYMPAFDPAILTDAELAMINTFLGSK